MNCCRLDWIRKISKQVCPNIVWCSRFVSCVLISQRGQNRSHGPCRVALLRPAK